LDEALELAAMLGGEEMLCLLLDSGADPAARGAAAMAWARQLKREPQLLTALRGSQVRLEASGSSRSSICSGVGNLAVAAWCLGLQHELSGLRGPDTPPPKLQSLQQFLEDNPAPDQRTVANLLEELQWERPELFTGEPSKQRR
jgi:ankyrin repeat protein